MEWRPYSQRQYQIDSAGKGLLMRHKPTTAPLVDLHIGQLVGNPGIGIEILNDNYIAAPTNNAYYPNTDTGKNVAGWTNASSVAPVFGDLSDLSDATYARNSGTLTGAPLYLDFRLNRGALTTRIRRFVIVARCANTIDVFNNGAALVRASLMIGGTRYGFSTFTGMVPLSGIQYATIYWEFPYNPATLQPWTVTDFANFSTGTDSIGIEVRPWGAPLRPLAFRIAELALATEECVENRVRSFYATSIGSLGLTPRWFERTMTAGAAANGNYNYLHVFGWFKADGSNFFTVPLLQDPGVLYATGYTATTAAAPSSRRGSPPGRCCPR